METSNWDKLFKCLSLANQCHSFSAQPKTYLSINSGCTEVEIKAHESLHWYIFVFKGRHFWSVGVGGDLLKTKSLLPPDHKSEVSWEDTISGSPDWRSGHLTALQSVALHSIQCKPPVKHHIMLQRIWCFTALHGGISISITCKTVCNPKIEWCLWQQQAGETKTPNAAV